MPMLDRIDMDIIHMRRKILFVCPAELPQIDLRLEGYRNALEDAGIEFRTA